MKLLRLSYHDLGTEWGFDDLTFLTDVSLLVGASGVGKTRILRVIQRLRQIANDTPHAMLWGDSWTAEFQDDARRTYLWNGQSEKRDSPIADPDDDDDDDDDDEMFDEADDERDRKRPRITSETLCVDGKKVFEREGNQFKIPGKTIDAKLSPYKSGLSLLSEEESIKPAKAAISQILLVDSNEEMNEEHRIFDPGYRKMSEHFKDLDSIRNSRLSTRTKLALVYSNAKEVFNQIASAFCDIFPSIQEVRIDLKTVGPFAEMPIIKMKERGVSGYFSQHALSSGMRRTLMHLARVALWPNGTLILIDEFENSLGANCIDVVAQGILGVGNRLQFIITSHHPYIINSIPMDRWKVIARDRGRIESFTTEQLKVGRSKHSAFTQLINTDVFKYGTLPQ